MTSNFTQIIHPARRRRIFVAGQHGMLGSAIVRRLFEDVGAEFRGSLASDIDLANPQEVSAHFEEHRPEEVYVAAGRVSSDSVRSQCAADFLQNNLKIVLNVLDAAVRFRVARLLLLNPFSLTARSGLSDVQVESRCIENLADAYRRQYGLSILSLYPAVAFGPNGRLSECSHCAVTRAIATVLRARRERSQTAVIHGSAAERVYAIDADTIADAAVFLMHTSVAECVALPCVEAESLEAIVAMVTAFAGYTGKIEFDGYSPPGIPGQMPHLRATDLGWKPRHSLREAILWTVNSYAVPTMQVRKSA